MPALKDRLEDILPLSKYFIDKINTSYGLGITDINEDVLALFYEYKWIGNVRELEHILECACIIAGSGPLKLEYFKVFLSRIYKNENTSEISGDKENPLNEVTAMAEKEMIYKTLIEAKGNKSAVAKLLRIDRSSLYNKLKKYGIKV